MRTNKIAVWLFAMIMFSLVAHADPIDEGKAIFMSRCAGCHNVNKNLTGPALAGVDQRRSIEWIVNFVHSSQTMVKQGDKDAVTVFEKFNKIPMPDHPDLTDENIKQIVEYIKAESKPTGGDSKAPFATPTRKTDNMRPLSSKDYGIFGVYLLVVAALITSLLFAVQVRTMQQKKQEEDVSARP
jgi:mono/diheme cytochrome c family protein